MDKPVPSWLFGLTATEISVAESLAVWLEADVASKSACLRGALAALRELAGRYSDASDEGLPAGRSA